jgi:predicted nicotinamide N-methyase
MSPVRLRYQTIEFGTHDIHLRTLRDVQQYADDAGLAEALGISSANWALFGVVWASGRILAQLMCDQAIDGKRVLEVGCGVGLASLVLNSRRADITATDYHPEAEAFLTENVRINQGRSVPFVRAGWADEDCGLGTFDLVIGSDLLYERGHPALLATFIERHARPSCEVIMVDPGRGNHARFTRRMANLGYSHSAQLPEDIVIDGASFRGRVSRYRREARRLHAN